MLPSTRALPLLVGIALALSTTGAAHAGTDVIGWRVNSIGADEDGTKTHRAIVNTTGDIPDAVGLSLVSTSSEGDDIDISMSTPYGGVVLTSGSLDLLVQPDGGTATLVILGLGSNGAVGDEFEVVLPLHPEDGGEADVVFTEGEGVISAALTAIEGEVDAYSVELAFDFEITGDITGFEYFDVTVQEVDGDVSVIDEQAELVVDGSDLRWRTDVETAATSLAIIRYAGAVTITSAGAETEAEVFNTYINDADPTDELATILLGTTTTSVERNAGNYKLVARQLVHLYEDDVPTSSLTFTSEDGTVVATIEPTLKDTTGLFFVDGLEFESSLKGTTVSFDVDMNDADGALIATETVTTKIRGADTRRANAFANTAEAYVWGVSAREESDGTVRIGLAIHGDLAGEVTELSVDFSSLQGMTSDTEQTLARDSQLVSLIGSTIVEDEYGDTYLDFAAELQDDSGGSVDTIMGKEKPKKKGSGGMPWPKPRRRAMKTAICG